MRDLLGALAPGEVNEHRFVPHNSPGIVLAASKSVKMVREFIEAGSYANLADDKGTTALMVAARRGDMAMIRYLIDQGADVNAKSVDMRTALMFAYESGHFDIVKLLLSSGAEVYAADNRGVTVLMVCSAFPNLARTISMLVSAGAPVDSTALRHAAWRGVAIAYRFESGWSRRNRRHTAIPGMQTIVYPINSSVFVLRGRDASSG